MENLNILVTGGCGFIGSNIVEYLLKNSVKSVRILDNLSTGFIENINPLLNKYNNLTYIHGDISNLDTCRKAVKNMDVICHQAALGSVPRSINDPLSSHISNVNGFLNILISAKEEGIKRIVYASSSSVYGDHKSLPKVEEKIGTVLSPYAATKKIDEIYGNVFSRCYGLECIGLRYFNVFGPKQNPGNPYAAVIPIFAKEFLTVGEITVNGDGETSRDFTFVQNVVQMNDLCLFTEDKGALNQIYNTACSERISLNQMISALENTTGNKIKVNYGPERKGDIKHSEASIEKAKKLLGYEGLTYFNEGLRRTIEWLKDAT